MSYINKLIRLKGLNLFTFNETKKSIDKKVKTIKTKYFIKSNYDNSKENLTLKTLKNKVYSWSI